MSVNVEPAVVDLSVIPARIPNQIGHEDRMADGGRVFVKMDPAAGRPLCEVVRSTRGDVDLAVARAKAVQPAWAATTVVKRGDILRNIALLMREHRDDIAALVARETGKSKKDALGETDDGDFSQDISYELPGPPRRCERSEQRGGVFIPTPPPGRPGTMRLRAAPSPGPRRGRRRTPSRGRPCDRA